MNPEDYRKHVSKVGYEEANRGDYQYAIYECDYCDHEIAHRPNHDRSILWKKAKRHIDEHHEEVTQRDTYPNESEFREWAGKVGAYIREVDPGDPLVAVIDPMNRVRLHADGMIVAEAERALGGVQNNVSVNGNRLQVDGEGYISDKTFPVFQR